MMVTRFIAGVLIWTWMIGAPSPASAQSVDEDERPATIDFEVGDYDAERGDWPITVVTVSGDLEADEVFVVELRDGEGEIVWAGEGVFSPPTTSVTVDSFVAVGDVDEAAIGQMLPEETTATTTTTTAADPAVAGDVETDSPTPDPPTAETPEGAEAPEATEQPGAPPPDVAGDVVTADQLTQQGSGGVGGAGQLALSMVIAVVFVAILFRAPLPAATTTRWRK